MMSKISIIVPNYNTEKYLPRCLDSLIGQTFKDIEIILIDDGSKDNSIQVMQKYAQKDKRIKVFTQENSGPARARNQGLENASGKYLMFCDSDDWYELNMCQVMYDTIEKQKVDVVYCDAILDFEEDLPQQEKDVRTIESYYTPLHKGKFLLSEKVAFSTKVVLWNKIWRRDLIEKYHIRFPDGHEHDDDAFWYMYSFVAKNIFYLKDKLYHYFLRAGSIMSTQFNKKPKNRMDRLAIAEYTLEFLLKHHLEKKYLHAIIYIFLFQLRGGIPFFSERELHQNCRYASQLLSDKLKVKGNFIYNHPEILFLKTKSHAKLACDWLWNRLCVHFWKNKNEKRYQKYMIRIKKNDLYWKYLKGKNDD